MCVYSMCACVIMSCGYTVCTLCTNFFLLTVFFYCEIGCMLVWFTWCLCVCLRVCLSIRKCVYSLSWLTNDDVETKHFWPVCLLRCGDWFSGVTVVFCLIWRQHHKTVLSSMEQMVLYGVGSVYYGNRGQKVLSVEWFLSMQAAHINICYTHLIFLNILVYMPVIIYTVLHIHWKL